MRKYNCSFSYKIRSVLRNYYERLAKKFFSDSTLMRGKWENCRKRDKVFTQACPDTSWPQMENKVSWIVA
jgi:hypothetical protein